MDEYGYKVKQEDYIITLKDTYYGEADVLPAGSIGVVKRALLSRQEVTAHFQLDEKNMTVITELPEGYWEPLRGMLASVYTPKHNIYPYSMVTVVTGTDADTFTATTLHPPMWIVQGNGVKPLRLCRESAHPSRDQFIGLFVWTSDSRFRKRVSRHPVPIYEVHYA